MSIIHFNLGLVTDGPCDSINDRLIIAEEYDNEDNLICVQHDVDTYISKTNSIHLLFHSNSKLDAPGFKLLYQDGKLVFFNNVNKGLKIPTGQSESVKTQ